MMINPFLKLEELKDQFSSNKIKVSSPISKGTARANKKARKRDKIAKIARKRNRK